DQRRTRRTRRTELSLRFPRVLRSTFLQESNSLFSIAYRISSAFVFIPSLSSTRVRYVLTVLTLNPSARAISDTVRPDPSSRRNWYSRSERESCGGASVFACQ